MSDIYSAIFSPYQQSTLGVSPDYKWVIYPPPADTPLFYLGCRPFDLDPATKSSGHNPSSHSATATVFRQTYLIIGQDARWYLSRQTTRKHDLRSLFLSLPVELRLRILNHLLVTGNHKHKWIVDCTPLKFTSLEQFVGSRRGLDRGEELEKQESDPARVTVDAYGQLKLKSLQERWPEVYKFSGLLNTPPFQREAMEIFWSVNEIVIDVRGLLSFYENWSVYVKKLKVVIPTWDPKRCGQKEKSDLEQQFRILTQSSWPKLKEIRVVVCFWGGVWGLFEEQLEISLKGDGESEDAFREIDLKWDALAAALLDLRGKNILKDVVKRIYVECFHNRHSFLPLLSSLDRSDTQPWHEEILRRNLVLDRWESTWEMTAPEMDAEGTDLRDRVKSFAFPRYKADVKFTKDQGWEYRKTYDHFAIHLLNWIDRTMLEDVKEMQNASKRSYPYWWRFSHWKLHTAIRKIISAREPSDKGHSLQASSPPIPGED